MMKNKLSFILAIPMILILSLSGTYAETTQERPIVNGVSEIQRTIYTIHFADGTAKLVTGAFKHSGGDLSPDVKKQIDDFFAKKSVEWKTSLKMATDDGSRNIGAITQTDVRLSVVSFSIDGSNYIRVSPTEIIHNHGDNQDHKTQVTTLWDPFGSIRHFAQNTFHKAASFTTSSFHKATNVAEKAANVTSHFAKTAATKTADFTKKSAIKAAPVIKKIVKIGVPVAGEVTKEGIALAENIIPAVVASIPEMVGGGVADTEIGAEVGAAGGVVAGAVAEPAGGEVAGVGTGVVGGVLGAAVGILGPLVVNVGPAVLKSVPGVLQTGGNIGKIIKDGIQN